MASCGIRKQIDRRVRATSDAAQLRCVAASADIRNTRQALFLELRYIADVEASSCAFSGGV